MPKRWSKCRSTGRAALLDVDTPEALALRARITAKCRERRLAVIHQSATALPRYASVVSGEGRSCRRLISAGAPVVAVALAAIASVAVEARAAGALAVGACGAYGYAFDYRQRADAARPRRIKKCDGDCKPRDRR